MTIEKMREQLYKLKERKRVFNEGIDRRIDSLEREYDLALAAQTQRIFTRHKLSADELNKLKFASRAQLKKLLAFIDNEIEEPSPNRNRNEKETEENE